MTNGSTQKKRKQPPAVEDNSEPAMETPLQTEKVRKAKKSSEWMSVAYLDSLHHASLLIVLVNRKKWCRKEYH